ncbi:MAG: ATP-dependent DNA ligase [Solirubrobacteraceae bacterium]
MRFGEIQPQLARGKSELPRGEQWLYEPKYDGFRAIVFVSPGAELQIQSRGGKDLRRYFPELSLPAGRYVADGEILVRDGGFGALQQRIHPAASRVELLSVQTPAHFLAFDLLEQEGEELLESAFADRRTRLEAIAGLELTPLTADAEVAAGWLAGDGEGVVAKLNDAPYAAGKRTAMVKVKRVRTIDCVVIGYRPGKAANTVGSLILGLHDEAGELRAVGHSSGLSAKRKRELVEELRPYATGERGAAEPSRWTDGRELEWVALRPELVVEITFDHRSDGRIRHGTRILRWRQDKAPEECLMTQLDS